MKSNFLIGVGFGIVLCLLSLSLLLMIDSNKENVEPMPVINEMVKVYSIEEDSIDMFARWQEWQPNELSQREWDAYMENEDN